MFCVKCGTQQPPESGFCIKCGAKLVTEETSQPTVEPIQPIAPAPVVEPAPVSAVAQEEAKTSMPATAGDALRIVATVGRVISGAFLLLLFLSSFMNFTLNPFIAVGGVAIGIILSAFNLRRPVKIKKIMELAVAVILLVVVIVVSLGGNLGGGGSRQGNVNIDTVTTGFLTMATDADFYPFQYLSNAPTAVDGIDGIDVAIARIIAEELGLQLRVVDMDFANINTSVQAGQVDIGMAAITISAERLEFVDFTIPYIDVDNDPLGISIRQGNTELLNAINNILERIGMDGTIDEIIARYENNAGNQTTNQFPGYVLFNGSPAGNGVSGNANQFEFNGVTLDRNRDELIALFGEPLNEWFESVYWGMSFTTYGHSFMIQIPLAPGYQPPTSEQRAVRVFID